MMRANWAAKGYLSNLESSAAMQQCSNQPDCNGRQTTQGGQWSAVQKAESAMQVKRGQRERRWTDDDRAGTDMVYIM